tara:strand:- start:1983 stop:2414 length:432 start_codon:yes stop_codon:yes gene_type:complete
MALTGTLTKYIASEHASDTETITITFPADLTEGHPHYDLRGTTTTETIPVTVETSTDHSDVYVFISATSVQYVGYDASTDTNNVNLYYIYKVYNSKSEKDTLTDPLLEDGISTSWDYSSNLNPTEAAYTHLKTVRGFENLINL